jgi:hypothetical protein
MASGHLLSLVLLAGNIDATAPDVAVLDQAEADFQEGVRLRDQPNLAKPLFQKAAEGYETLRRRGIDNAALARNEANAFLLADDLPRAILAYRRGLRVTLNDSSLRAGLTYARSQVAYPQTDYFARPPTDHRPPWLPRIAAGWYVLLATLAYSAACLALTRWWMTRRGKWLGGGLMAFAIAGLFVGGLFAEAWRDADFSRYPVTVIAEDGVLLRSGNGLSYPPRYSEPLNRGVEARLLHVRGDWLQIEVAGGEVGWILREYAVVETGGKSAADAVLNNSAQTAN